MGSMVRKYASRIGRNTVDKARSAQGQHSIYQLCDMNLTPNISGSDLPIYFKNSRFSAVLRKYSSWSELLYRLMVNYVASSFDKYSEKRNGSLEFIFSVKLLKMQKWIIHISIELEEQVQLTEFHHWVLFHKLGDALIFTLKNFPIPKNFLTCDDFLTHIRIGLTGEIESFSVIKIHAIPIMLSYEQFRLWLLDFKTVNMTPNISLCIFISDVENLKIIFRNANPFIFCWENSKQYNKDRLSQQIDGSNLQILSKLTEMLTPSVEDYCNKLSEDLILENQRLFNENESVKQLLQEKNDLIEKLLEEYVEKESHFKEEKKLLENEILKFKETILGLEEHIKGLEDEKKDLLSDVGRLSVEIDSKMTKEKDIEIFKKIFPSKSAVSVNASEESAEIVVSPDNHRTEENIPRNQNQPDRVGSSSGVLPSNESNGSSEPLRFPVQIQETDGADGGNTSLSSAISSVHNAYKQLLLAIANNLLTGDIMKLKDWVHEQFLVETNLTSTEIILQLDRKGVINASNTSVLREFLKSILRIDLVHLIDEYHSGNYVNLRRMVVEIKQKSVSSTRDVNRAYASRRIPSQREISEQNFPLVRTDTMVMPPVSNQHDMANVHHQKPSETLSRRNRLSTHEDVPNDRARDTARGNESRSREASNGTTENSRHQEHRTRARNQNARFNFPSTSNNPNGRSERSNNVKKQPDRWLCNHYKRRCMVKFECCDKYWACHRCHNETSTCQQKKLKSRDTTMVKCMECGKEQQFGQFCVSCNTQFADFYCGLCKHLTGRDDHPYHCEKCGICRIHGDRSFHCDVCGVCLDVQLRGNHKCRPDSAHDNCGICLEDAFTGCQILPCSHKVHKECSKLMIQNGM
ncbi:uncharacterized protein LOC114528982 isoform X2 [Dendronephthya gigantea]|nr:uncharacterized protein LOC114528982 isoform X2 [Dendronephthya gigantea]